MSDSEEKKDITQEAGEETGEKLDAAAEKPAVMPEPGKVRLNRRNFIGKMAAGCGGVLGLEACYAGFKMMAAKPVAEKKPITLNLSQLPINSRTTIIYGGNKVEVIRTEKGVKALSMVCTHLGCLVIWEEQNKTYHCPCHDAYFDADGNVISGPPTQPLEEIPVTVSGSTVTIGN